MHRTPIRKTTLALALGLVLAPLAAAHAADAQQTKQDAATTRKPDEKKAVSLSQVIVTAVPEAVTVMGSSVSVSTLDATQLQQSGAQSASGILRDIPGIRAESSGGDGNANISVRGLPEASGGAKYVQYQIDGMPVLEFGDIAFATPDTFIRPDYNLRSVEVVRGGSSSIFASNAPGAIINFITKTGRTKGGAVGLTYGLGTYDTSRLDFDYGGPINSTTRYHVGGFIHSGQGQKPVGYTAQQGGQFMGNITHDIDGGFLRLSFQYLNDKEPVYLPVPLYITGSNSNPSVSSIPGFSIQDGALQTPYWQRDLSMNAAGNRVVTNLADGYHSKVTAIGGIGEFTLQGGWKMHEQFRIAKNSGSFVGPYPAEVNAASALAQEIGGSGATLSYATGPNAGQAIANPAALAGNGLAVRTILFNVTLPNMDNATNNLTFTRNFDTSSGPLDVQLGYYHSLQHINQDWHWNTYLETVQGQNAQLLNVSNAQGQLLTQNGLVNYGEPYFGNCCQRSYDVQYTMDAPFVSLTWEPGNWRFDGGLRFDRMRASGSYAGSTGTAPIDVNQDGIIEYPEQTVPVVNNAAPMPVDYTRSHLEYSFGANYMFDMNLAAFARVSSGARFNADRLLFGGGILPDGNATQPVAVNVVKQYEMGLKWGNRHYSLFATGFLATTQEQNQDVTQNLAVISRHYRAKGLELQGSVNYGGFALRAGATYTLSRITADAITPDDVGNAPQRQAHWIYQISPVYNRSAWTVGATVIGTTKSPGGTPNGLVMPGFVQTNLFAQYAINPRMNISLYADNVFNTVGLTEIDSSPNVVTANGLNTARSILPRSVYVVWQYKL